MISGSPKQLHIYNAATNSDQTVALAEAPQNLSLTPDGLHAAVAMVDSVAYVNLQTGKVEQTFGNIAVPSAGCSLCFQCDGGSAWAAWLFDCLAYGRIPAACLHFKFRGWACESKRGHCSCGHERPSELFRYQRHGSGAGYHWIFCAFERQYRLALLPCGAVPPCRYSKRQRSAGRFAAQRVSHIAGALWDPKFGSGLLT